MKIFINFIGLKSCPVRFPKNEALNCFKMRHDPQNIASVNGHPLFRGEVSGGQTLAFIGRTAVRKITAKENVRGGHDRSERGDGALVVALCRVIVKALYFGQDAIGQYFFGGLFHVKLLPSKAAPKKRHGATTVRPDPVDVGELVGRSSVEHACNGAGRVGGVLNHSRRYKVSRWIFAAIRKQGVYIDGGTSAVELLPNWPKALVTLILVAITGHETNTVGLQCVHGVFNFFHGTFGVHQRQCGKGAKTTWVVASQLGCVFIGLTCHAAIEFNVVKVRARYRQGEY